MINCAERFIQRDWKKLIQSKNKGKQIQTLSTLFKHLLKGVAYSNL